jgi:hypothetical protein
VQETLSRFHASLVVDEKCDQVHLREGVTAELMQVLGEGAEVEVQFVRAIPRTARGKVRPVISLLKR